MSVQKKGKVWYVVLEERDPSTGQRRQRWVATGSTRKKEALDYETTLKAQRLRGIEAVPSRKPLATYLLTEWLPTIRNTVRPSTLQAYEQMIHTHVVPRIGSLELRRLSPTVLNRLYADLLAEGRVDGKGGLSPKSVRNVHLMMHKALGDAVRWDQLSRNPAQLSDPPKVPRKELRAWTPEHLDRFLTYSSDHRLGPIFRLIAMTGIRRGEVLGLVWPDIDFEGRSISIRRARISVAYQPLASEPKTARGRRNISLDGETIRQLRGHRKKQLEERMAARDAYNAGDHLVTDELGQPIHPDRFSKLFAALVAESGLPRLSLHGLRHTHASIALAAGAHPKIVSERLGHSTVAITLDTYSHVTPNLQEQVAEAVAGIVDGKAEVTPPER